MRPGQVEGQMTPKYLANEGNLNKGWDITI
jgi:hypothetical protein